MDLLRVKRKRSALDISFDSDAEEAIQYRITPKSRAPKLFKKRDFDENVPESVYRERYRVPKEAIDFLEERLSPILQHRSNRNHPLTCRQQVIT
jgi:hypothetical protein